MADRWADDSIQFPRLIAEISATVDISETDWTALCDSMGLTSDQVTELFERAHNAWEHAKAAV